MKSSQIDKVIEQVRFLPNSQVDCGTEQGQKQFFAQLSKHVTTPELLELPFELYVVETNKSLARIENLISPYSLPADYLSFLNHYGGITISSKDFYFASLGFGPMAEEWYPYLMGKAGHSLALSRGPGEAVQPERSVSILLHALLARFYLKGQIPLIV